MQIVGLITPVSSSISRYNDEKKKLLYYPHIYHYVSKVVINNEIFKLKYGMHLFSSMYATCAINLILLVLITLIHGKQIMTVIDSSPLHTHSSSPYKHMFITVNCIRCVSHAHMRFYVIRPLTFRN